MDILARKKEREAKREKERIKKLVTEEIFKKPQKAYVPTGKKLTIIMLVLLALAIPYIYMTTDVVVRESCGLMPGIDCEELRVTLTTVRFEVRNHLKDDYNITISLEDCFNTEKRYIRQNTAETFEFKCEPMERVVKKKIYFEYVGYSGLPHNSTGSLVGKANGEMEPEGK